MQTTKKRLLLISNPKSEQGYLVHAEEAIKDFLGSLIQKILFIPFGGVSNSLDKYIVEVQKLFQEMGYELESVHEHVDPMSAVLEAEAYIVGGGSTFHLPRELYELRILEKIRQQVNRGKPYIGWSTGSNIISQTILITNMPVREAPALNALALVPFQLKPHFRDFFPSESRKTPKGCIEEFIDTNSDVYVVGLREGSILRVEGSNIKLLGQQDVRILLRGQEAAEFGPQSLNFLLSHRGRDKENVLDF
ncbi:MAG: dipeptidase PepE [Candidatus Hodarchaeota archaeon]